MTHAADTLFPSRATLLAAVLLGSMAVTVKPIAAQSDACAVVKPADAAALLGGVATPNPSPKGGSCTWKAADPKRSLGVLVYSKDMPGEMMYTGARGNAGKENGSSLTDEGGIGDKAFSIKASFGASIIMLKGGRLMQLQYFTGGAGTDADRDVLRALAKKAIAAF